MTTVFVCDSEVRSKYRRNWQKLVGDHTTLYWNDAKLAGGNPARGDVVLCHRVESDVQAALNDLADREAYLIYIGQNNEHRSVPQGNTYRRAKGVAAPDDAHFSACFSYFLAQLRKEGKPDWQLLEGPPPPDALLAYHLLSLLPTDDRDAASARRELAITAMAEANTIANANPDLIPLEDIDDPQQRRDFLLACC